MKVRYSRRALRQIEAIFDYITKDNTAAASNVVRRIRATAQSLEHFPHLGRQGLVPGTFERTVVGLPYIIVYQINVGDHADEALVLGVFHGRQDRE